MNRKFLVRAILVGLVTVSSLVPALPAAAQQTDDTPQQPADEGQVYLPILRGGGLPLTPQITYEVDYAANTVVIDEQTLAATLVAVSEDNAEYRFQPTPAAVSQLQTGDIVIFSGLALGKVVDISQAGQQTVIQTEATTLDQAIRDGTIAWTYPVNWMELPDSVYAAATVGAAGDSFRLVERQDRAAARSLVTQLAAPALTYTYQGKIEGWDVSLTFTPGPARLGFDINATRKIGTAEAAVSGTGWISTFIQETLLTYEESTPTKMTVESLGLSGEMELKWAALTPGAETLTEIASFSIPAEIPIPLRLGPIPAVLKIKANLQIVPELRVPQASSGGSYKMTYHSDQGFVTENNLVSGVGDLKTVNIGLSGDTGSAGFGPVGFGLGLEFPRLELSVLGTTVAFITIKGYSASIFLTEPPCQETSTLLFATAGYTLGLMGYTVAKDQKELWRKEFVKYKDDKPC